jgi:hypothetical protein
MTETTSTLNNIEKLKLDYARALSNYENARTALAKIQAEYDRKRHAKRVELYEAKADGLKITEEAIRSASITEFADLGTALLKAQAEVDCYRAELDFARDMFLNHTNN